MSPPIARALRESALWVFGALALILFAALASYDGQDPGFSSSAEHGSVRNWIGPVGAWLADVFFFLFGRPAFLFPAMLGIAGWLCYRAVKVPELNSRATLLFRGGGFLLTLITACGLAALHWDGSHLPSTAGGVLGALVGNNLAHGLSFLGATLLMLALWLAGVSLFLGVSWLAVMDRLGRSALRLMAWLRERIAAARTEAAGRERNL